MMARMSAAARLAVAGMQRMLNGTLRMVRADLSAEARSGLEGSGAMRRTTALWPPCFAARVETTEGLLEFQEGCDWDGRIEGTTTEEIDEGCDGDGCVRRNRRTWCWECA